MSRPPALEPSASRRDPEPRSSPGREGRPPAGGDKEEGELGEEDNASSNLEDPASSATGQPSPSTERADRTSRGQESVQTRRSARRASIDPYPSQTESMSRSTRRSTRTRARSAEAQPAAPQAEQRSETVEETQEMSEQSSSDEAVEATRGKHFELVVLQQPEIGAEAGLRKVTLGRLPIVPAPVVQLIVKDDSGHVLDIEMPYLFCSCSLRDVEGAAPVEIAPSIRPEAEELSALIGNLVRNPHRVQDLNGNTISVFVFEDMSVRMQGRFSLEFSLGQARQVQLPKLAAVSSEPFKVVEWKEYPGRPAADTVTELSMHLHNQGVPMYIPPLVLSQGTASPPPPSTLPFPSDVVDHLDGTEGVEPESDLAEPAASNPPAES